MTRITFEEVKVKGVRKWTDEEGKKRQKTKVFFQTVNPYNRNQDGSQKTREQIRAELVAQRDAWVGGGK